MKTELGDKEFAVLGERMKSAWDESADDREIWLRFLTDIQLRNLCARWFLGEGGEIHLLLEEHKDAVDAFFAGRRNNDSIEPLRRIGWRKVQGDWETLTWN